jgi:hypothetical protein
MFLAPKPDHQYRHTRSLQLVPADGFEADETDLDIDRALQCGDLVEVEPPAPKKARRPAPAES